MVVICVSICRAYDERESSMQREWPHPLLNQLLGIWKSHDKAQAKSLDDRLCRISSRHRYMAEWYNPIMKDGVVIKGLAPRRLDPMRYHLNPNSDLNELEKGMPWRTIQDEFGTFKWVDHAGI